MTQSGSHTASPSSSLDTLDDGLWSIDHPEFSVAGVPIGTKTGVVRLPDDQLAILTPGPLSESQADDIRQLGRVTAIVATNRLHHLFLEDALEAFPDADLIGAPGLPDKRDDLEFDAEFSADTLPAPLDEHFQHHLVRGAEAVSEVVLFHPATDTIFVTDFGFNLQNVQGLWPRLFMWLNGGWGNYELTFVARRSIDDPDAFLTSIDTILQWPFSRIWLPHGDVVDHNAAQRFHDAYEKLRG
jgi:hypothetical protein